MQKQKYETMTELGLLELVHIAVSTLLEDVKNGRVIEGVPKLTEEQLEGISFESSFQEHRIKFYPEENREITLHIKSEEHQYEEGEE